MKTGVHLPLNMLHLLSESAVFEVKRNVSGAENHRRFGILRTGICYVTGFSGFSGTHRFDIWCNAQPASTYWKYYSFCLNSKIRHTEHVVWCSRIAVGFIYFSVKSRSQKKRRLLFNDVAPSRIFWQTWISWKYKLQLKPRLTRMTSRHTWLMRKSDHYNRK